MKPLVALLLFFTLGGCVTTGGGSVTGGECRVFERPPYAVRGVTQYDQDVADNFVESGVGGCKWTRPAARPAALDATPAAKHVAKPVKRRSLVARVKRRSLVARVKAKVWPGAAVAPVEAVPDMPAHAPRAAPRSVIDELLYPSDVR